MSLPLVIPFLIGGAVGGALPDIDVKGSAVEKLGSKSTRTAGRVLRKMGGVGNFFAEVVQYAGQAVDLIILKPLGWLWRFLAENIFARGYLAVYNIGAASGKPLGEKLGWLHDEKSWCHRGGLTHSLSFLVTSCIFTLPFAFIFSSWEFWAGCEVGIISHLVTDAMCRSGTKFFFPWAPKIGFGDREGENQGRDVRILPYSLQVSTGKDRLTDDELDRMEKMDKDKAKEQRKLRFREKMWQKIFQLLAVALLLLIGFGVGPVPGGVAFAIGERPSSQQVQQAQPAQQQGQSQQGQAQQQSQQQPAAQSQQQQSQQGHATSSSGERDPRLAGALAEGVNPMGGQFASSDETTGKVPENKGRTSLTLGDIGIEAMPAGILKLPDESLHVLTVGEVNKANLDNPKWVFTQDEKDYLLAAATRQRVGDLPASIESALSSSAGDSSGDGGQIGADSSSSTANPLQQFLNGLTGGMLGGGSGGDGYLGFYGLTPFTQSTSEPSAYNQGGR